MDGFVSSRLLLAGRMDRTTDIAARGVLAIDDFSIVDTTGEKLASFHRFYVNLDSLNTPASLYNLRALVLDEPYIRFGMYVDGYNFDRLLTAQATDTVAAPMEDYSNIFQMMAGYIRDLSKEYLLKEYRVDSLRLTSGHVIFTDYTLEEKFQYDLDSLSLRSDNFNSDNERIVIDLASRLNTSGILEGCLLYT